MNRPMIQEIMQSSLPREQVKRTIDEYNHLFSEGKGGDVGARKSKYADMVNQYYNMVTDFYEFGWGQSFHFAPTFKGESFDAAIARYDMFVAARAGFVPGMHLLDVGCGVGGPMRTVARFTGAKITGITINEYQIQRARRHNERAGLSEQCDFIQGDFHHVPVPDQAFDGAYAIEATCHSPDRPKIFREIFRVLKPGAHFAGYEWCVTDKYDPRNAEHRRIKLGIEQGTSLPELITIPQVVEALKSAGFEVVSHHDHALTSDPETPWWDSLAGRWYTPRGFPRSPAGRWLTNRVLQVLEAVKVAPTGTVAVSSMLNEGADALIEGGVTGIFSPSVFFHVRKPG